jgi:hypothetical protein
MWETRMSAFSPEELRGQIAAGKYAVDSGTLAEHIISEFATIRRVRRMLMSEEGGATAETGRAAQPPAAARSTRHTRASPTAAKRTASVETSG